MDGGGGKASNAEDDGKVEKKTTRTIKATSTFDVHSVGCHYWRGEYWRLWWANSTYVYRLSGDKVCWLGLPWRFIYM